MKIPAFRALALTAALTACGASNACRKGAEEKPKPPKSKEVVASAWKERGALNSLTQTLRELAAAGAGTAQESRAARAGALREKLKKVPDKDFPEDLRPPWQEMISVLDAAAKAPGAEVPADLQKRGASAAAALNAALARQGLTEFRF